ncbi:putative cysteine desulfurase [bacterium BMS3Abin05]|nr:putative cysteine desulfurase [bacterium BMS3Abin05]GBE28598.1 putative cysteine desulfurase [bacterium BMS3Bbin03]
MSESKSRRNFLKGIATTAAGLPFLMNDAGPVRAMGHPETPAFKKSALEGISNEKFWKLVRAEFPLTHERIYFNTGGLGPSPRYVIDATTQMMLRINEISETKHYLFDKIRKQAAEFVGCDTDELAFTRNATEGMNIIARGAAQAMGLKAGDEIITTTHEHPGGAMPWLGLMKDLGVKIVLMDPVSDPDENIARLLKRVSRKTKGISISHVTCTLGYKFPVKEICRAVHDRGLFCALDGAQVVGMFPLDLHEIGCDFYTTSGHKWLLGPKGTGMVYIRKGIRDRFTPEFVGAYSNKKYDLDELVLDYKDSADATEYGTRNSALVVGLGAAMDFLNTIGMTRVAEHGAKLATHFKTEVQKIKNVSVLTPMDLNTSNSIATFKIKGMNYNAAVQELGRRKLRLRPVGEHHIDAVRVSFHVFNRMEEVDVLLKNIREMIERAG